MDQNLIDMATIDLNNDAGFKAFASGHDNTKCIFCNRRTIAVIFNILFAAVL